MIPPAIERRLLQGAILLAACVPLSAGLAGTLGRLPGLDPASSHDRYLSGLLLGIGLAFVACVPSIERRGSVVRVLAAIVAVGGLARLAASGVTGWPPSVILPLVMELIVTPLIALWRERVERRLPNSRDAR